jgi:phosphatidylethanolamine-binding protein (PEBP) family uncharacterized protein
LAGIPGRMAPSSPRRKSSSACRMDWRATCSSAPGTSVGSTRSPTSFAILPEGAVSGTAGVGRGAYFGPGAPAGPRYHHYVFELYALSRMLDLPVDATRAQLLDAIKDIIVGKAAYVGRFRQ